MSKFTDNNRKPALLSRIWRHYLKQYVGVLLVAVFFMAIEGGSIGGVSYYLKPVIDEVFLATSKDAIYPIAGIMFGIFLLRAGSSYMRRWLTQYVGIRVISDLQKDLSVHLMSQDVAFFNKHPPGALLERVRGDTQALQSVTSNALITLGRDSISLIALITVAVMIDLQWTLMVFGGIPLIILPVVVMQRKIRSASVQSRITSAKLSTRLDEIFHGIKAIKSNNLQDHEKHRVSEQVEQFLKHQMSAEKAKAVLPSLIDVVAGLGFVGVLLLASSQIIEGNKTPGDFLSFFASIALLFDPLRRLAGIGGQIQAASASLERIYELFDLHASIVDKPDAKPMVNTATGDIEFHDVSFSYGDLAILNGLNFVAPAGKITALVGPSGSGKTTVLNLLCRFEEVSHGQVLIGGQDVRDCKLQELRDNIAIVSQETALFDESIKENIRYGRMTASDTEINEVSEQALVEQFIGKFPDRLESPAGPRGSNLSGGQRQRVVIARAMLRDAPILLLDEATSALDSKTELAIQDALNTVSDDCTTLVIAHRLSTVRNADMICVIDQGKVIEQGQHDDLIALDGAYASLHSTLT